MVKSKIRLAQIMEKIRNALCQTRKYLEIYRYLDEHQKSEQFEQAARLFSTISDAVWREAILGITRLTDDDPESINFKMLLNMAENHPRILRHGQVGAREVVVTSQGKLASLDPVLKALRPVRDRELAHLDRKHLNDPAVLSPEVIKIQDISHCVDTLNMVLSDIWQALFGEPLPEDQESGQILDEMESLWKILEKDTEMARRSE